MNRDCDRCGQSAGVSDGLCEECTGWIREQGKLTDEELVEAVQFGGSPIASSDRFVATIGGVALPLLLSLFAVTFLLIDVCDSASNRQSADVPHGPVFVAFLAVLTSFVTVIFCAALARRRPWAASLVAAGVVVALAIPLIVVANMKLPAHSFPFTRISSLSFSLAGILAFSVVLQELGILALGLPLYLAIARRRRLAATRQRLEAIRRSGSE